MAYAPTLVGNYFSSSNRIIFNSPASSSSVYPGVAGHATCGGFGTSSRMWGLFSDHVVEMEVVIANGTILKASEKINPDLFFVRIPPSYVHVYFQLGSARG